jgi:succinyl-CoA synthetase beta subunit
VATTPEQAEEIARRVGKPVMVKAQVHVGGRGKAGGVKYCATPEVAREKAEAILGMDIKGLTVEKVLVTEAADIGTEAYVGIIVDRATKKPVFMVSAAGGIDIEEVAGDHAREDQVPPGRRRLRPAAVRGAAARLLPVPDAKQARAAGKIMQQLYKAFVENGCSLAEINPLVVTPAGEVIAVDAKMVIDDNELERAPTSRRCATRARRSRARWTPARPTSRSSSSTGTSAAS